MVAHLLAPHTHIVVAHPQLEDVKPTPLSWYRVLYIIRRPALCVYLTYFVTLGVFPGVMSEAVSTSLEDWYPVLLITTFNVCDTVGKAVSTQHKWVSYDKGSRKFTAVAAVVSLRFLFVPLVVFCVAPRSSPWIQSEAALFLFIIILGLTNG